VIPKHWMIPPLALACSFVAGSAHADGMRCGQRLVSSGDTRYEVRSRCGEPDAADQRTELRQVERRVKVPCGRGEHCVRTETLTVEIVVDEWVYDLGPQRFVRYVTFENGRLTTVETGSYGQKG